MMGCTFYMAMYMGQQHNREAGRVPFLDPSIKAVVKG